VTFGDVSGGGMIGSGEEPAGGLAAHFGVSNRWFLVQGVFGTWSAPFKGSPQNILTSDVRVDANLRAYDLGIEAGPIIRLGPTVELRGGIGIHALFGDVDVGPSSFGRASPAVFAAAQSSILPTRNGTRLRFGVEVRKYFMTTVGLEQLSRTLPAAGTYFGAYVGFELSNPGPKP
jgi:hypothetical protein